MAICWTYEVEQYFKRQGCPREFTPEEALEWIKTQYQKEGRSHGEIALMLRVTGPSVRNLLKILNVKSRPKGGPRNIVNCPVTEDEFKSMTYCQIAEKYQVHPTTVFNRCKPYRQKGG